MSARSVGYSVVKEEKLCAINSPKLVYQHFIDAVYS
jgi:hypothetical protein